MTEPGTREPQVKPRIPIFEPHRVCACSVSQVARHCAYDSAGQPEHMTERYPDRRQTLNQPLRGPNAAL